MADETAESIDERVPVVSETQRNDLGNFVAMKKLIDSFVEKAGGVKALAAFYKDMSAFTLTFNPMSTSQLEPHPPKFMLVLHATLELVKDRHPKDILLVLANTEYYTLWNCSEISDLLQCRLSRQWGNTDYWGDKIDINSHMLGDGVFLDAEGVQGMEALIAATWDKVKPKKTGPPPTPPAVEVQLSTLQLQLKSSREALAGREVEFNKVSLELHVQKGGTRENFVPPHPLSYVGMGGGGPPAPTAMDPIALITSPTIRDFFAQMVADQVTSQVATRMAALTTGGLPSSNTSAPTTINVAAQLTESKRQNFLRVEQIRPLFDTDEFDAAWKALDSDMAGKPTSYNMEFAQNHVREIVTADLGHNAQEPSRLFLTNASLFNFGTGAEGLSLEDFLGPKDKIGQSTAKFSLALMAVRNLYGTYFGSKMEIVMASYCCDITNLLLRHRGVPMRAMVFFVERTLAKLRQIGPCSHKLALQYMKETLKVDRTAQDFRDLLDQVSYGDVAKDLKKRDREEDDDAPGSLSVKVSRPKLSGGGASEGPSLRGPSPCYGWILKRCPGAVCTVAKNRRRGPNPHEWDAADDGTPAAKAFEKWVKANKSDWKKS